MTRRRRSRRVTLLVLAILIAGAAAAGAATVTVATGLLATSRKTWTHTSCTVTPAAVDTYVNEASKNTSYSLNSSLITNTSAGQRERVFIRFDLSGCAHIANAAVDAATLQLVVNSAAGGTRTLGVFRITSSWSSSVTWNTQPSWSSTAVGSFTASAGSTGTKSVDVTGDVNDWVQSSPTALPPYTSSVANYGWAIVDTGTSPGTVSMTSSEGTVANRPKLVVAYAY